MALLPSYSEKPDFLMLPSGVLENVDHVPNNSGFKQLSPFPLNTHPPTHTLLKWQQFSTTTKNYNSFFSSLLASCMSGRGMGKLTREQPEALRDLSSIQAPNYVGEHCRTPESILSTMEKCKGEDITGDKNPTPYW